MVKDKALRAKYIQKYGLTFFKNLDKLVKNQNIIEYYKEKYKSPMYLTMLIQHLSKEKRPIEIDEEVYAIQGVNCSAKYYSSNVHVKLKLIFGGDIFPKISSKPRPHKLGEIRRNAIKRNKDAKERKIKSRYKWHYKGECCIGCGEPFSVDITKHPSNLCGCLECYPNGIGFQKTTTRAENTQTIFK